MASVWITLRREDEAWPLFESEDPELVRGVLDTILERVGVLRDEPRALSDLRRGDHDD